LWLSFFFFHAEDGIRDFHVTGVQTCALPIYYRIATRRPLVVTIHDIGPLTHPQFFRNSHPWLLKLALNSALDRAAVIICISRAKIGRASRRERVAVSGAGGRLR